jgi:hypothetical protein
MKRVSQQARDVIIGARVVDVEIEPEECAFGRCLLNSLLSGVGGFAALGDRPFQGEMLSRSGGGRLLI